MIFITNPADIKFVSLLQLHVPVLVTTAVTMVPGFTFPASFTPAASAS